MAHIGAPIRVIRVQPFVPAPALPREVPMPVQVTLQVTGSAR